MRATTPLAMTGAIFGRIFTPTAVAMMSQVTISSMACSVPAFTARTGLTVVSTVSALETILTLYSPRRFISSIRDCMMSRNTTS